VRFVLTVLFGFALLATACGGDSSGSSKSPSAAAGASGTPAAPTPTLGPVLPTPVSPPEAGPALTVNSLTSEFAPTPAEFRALPTIEIDANGKKTGVSLATLAEKVGANPQTQVTIQGYHLDGRSIGFARYPLADIGAASVLVMDPQGHISFVSAKVPQQDWLNYVTNVSFP
jgi:hypothetical protein